MIKGFCLLALLFPTTILAQPANSWRYNLDKDPITDVVSESVVTADLTVAFQCRGSYQIISFRDNKIHFNDSNSYAEYRIDDSPPKRARRFNIDGRNLAIYNADDLRYAIQDERVVAVRFHTKYDEATFLVNTRGFAAEAARLQHC